MTTVYLHIGIPKTGTTSIQTFLFNNRDKLLEAGILYPLTRRSEQCLTGAYGHHKLSGSIMRQINEGSDLAMNDWQNLYQQSEVFNVLSKIPDSLIRNELISEADRISIMKTFEESNIKVAQEYLNRQDGKLFYKSLF